MKKLSDAAHHIHGQPMFQLLEKAEALEKQGRRILHFEIGTPGFESPANVVGAAMEALRAGKTRYVSSWGIEELRQAICRDAAADLGFQPTDRQVLILPANAGIYFLMRCVVNPGEEILVPDPAFSSYYSAIEFMGAKAVRMPLKDENAFQIDLEDLAKKVSDQTRLLIVNSPHNPTGSVLQPENMQKLGAFAKKNDLYILSDEVYRKVHYGEKAIDSPSSIDHCKERTIVLNSFSKSHAMSGWRLGYVIGPEPVIEKMALLLQTILSCVPPFIQYAGIAALRPETDVSVKTMVAELKKRRDVIVRGLNSIPGITCRVPEGAFYVFPDIRGTGLDAGQFASLILEKAGVALLPGTDFGKYGEDHVRLCYSTTEISVIEEAIEKMKAALQQAEKPLLNRQERRS